ncbi:PEBP-like protein [Clathrospora elynae]|uniref:PEBP-like protein n=1 Tax=Clathrospora elynae TaxID=706981 RepID=A0A6A5SE68_9PLEO|nr:PEBP-like protein [Clathrospora elynae]
MPFTALLDSLRNASLLPSAVIPSTFTPTIHLTVNFPSSSPNHGHLARVSEVKDQPTISIFPPPSPLSTLAFQSYTFLMIDPDAPTPADPKFGYWRHWVVSSIHPSLSPGNIVESGRTLTKYLAPGPKDESDPHRYLFLLFREPEGFEVQKGDVGGEEFVERRSFKVEEWVERMGLVLVGVQWMRGVGDGWTEEGKSEL